MRNSNKRFLCTHSMISEQRNLLIVIILRSLISNASLIKNITFLKPTVINFSGNDTYCEGGRMHNKMMKYVLNKINARFIMRVSYVTRMLTDFA